MSLLVTCTSRSVVWCSEEEKKESQKSRVVLNGPCHVCWGAVGETGRNVCLCMMVMGRLWRRGVMGGSLLSAVWVTCCSLPLFLLLLLLPLLLLPGLSEAADGDSFPCKVRFPGKHRVTLCHNASRARDLPSEDCGEAKGLVLTPLVLAPLAFYADCDGFHVNNLYELQCLGKRSHREEEYDRIVFDILDKVSGQNQLATSSVVVDRFPLTIVKDGQEIEDFSAFVAFKKLCKSADPEASSDMINMCSNQTVTGTFLYLTLRGVTPLPHTPSMCRCVLRPSNNIKLRALDVRLQNESTRRCGKSALKIEFNGTRKDIPCDKMSALYGNHELYSSDSPDEVTLTLTYISKEEIPTSVWINAQDTYQKMSVSCGGLIPLPTEEEGRDSGDEDEDGNNYGDDDGDDGGGKKQPDSSSAGVNVIIIPAVVVGGIILVIIVTVCIIRRRRSGSYSGLVPSCSPCCLRDEDEDDPIFYKPVALQEPVYAEPGKPRPSTTTPYVFPVDARLPDSQGVYSEPDPNGTLNLPRGASPPPVPELPPPGSPPMLPPGSPSMFPPGTPPPKPERTLLRKREQSTTSGPSEEDYDHIVVGGKTPLKAPHGRDGQNNIIGDREEDGVRAESNNVYDCLQHGDDYSQIGEHPKQQVKDNVYDTTA